jgi:hypothetical protein
MRSGLSPYWSLYDKLPLSTFHHYLIEAMGSFKDTHMIGGINVSLVRVQDRYGLTFSNFRAVEPIKTSETFESPDLALSAARDLIKDYYTPNTFRSR